jgi:hypothetical protein
MIDIVLYEPEIAPNTGNVIRLVANCGARLHLVRACVLAEERFWALLADFVSLVASAPRSWLARYGPVPAGHPFICGVQQGGLAVGPRPAPVALSVLPPGPLPLPAP